MSIPSVKFRPRTVSKNNPKILQCFISLYGIQAPKFSTQIRITPGLKWLQKEQHFISANPNDSELNNLAISKNTIILRITTQINNCFTISLALGKPVSAKLLKIAFEKEWNKGGEKPSVPSLLNNYDKFLLETTTTLAPKTVKKYQKAKDHLIGFIKTKKRVDLELEEINPLFGFEFFEYVKSLDNKQLKTEKISALTAKRYLLYIAGSLEFAFKKGFVTKNELAQVKPKVKKNKSNKTMVTEDMQLQIYNLEQLTQTERFVADITTFLFYTAFDFCDLYNFKQKTNIIEIESIKVIQKTRYKMRKSEDPEIVTIPINSILEEILFVKYPEYFPTYSYQTVRRIYKNLCARIGIKNYVRMSLKQIRKSGGTYYLNNDVPLKTVSAKIFGHTKQSITETIYTIIQDDTLLRHTKHLRDSPNV